MVHERLSFYFAPFGMNMEFLWAVKSCEERKFTFLRRVCATTSHPTHPAIIFRLRRLASPTSERERCHSGPRRPITAGPIYDPSFPGKKYKKGKKKSPSAFLFRTHQRKMEEAISDIRSAGEEKAQKRQLYTADRGGGGGGGNGSIFYFSPKATSKNHPSTKGHCCANCTSRNSHFVFAQSCKK